MKPDLVIAFRAVASIESSSNPVALEGLLTIDAATCAAIEIPTFQIAKLEPIMPHQRFADQCNSILHRAGNRCLLVSVTWS
jgi:hypothetical protein